jgi:hypothetical protein
VAILPVPFLFRHLLATDTPALPPAPPVDQGAPA